MVQVVWFSVARLVAMTLEILAVSRIPFKFLSFCPHESQSRVSLVDE